jgi:tetratricopeptide (TPR) repeat protein
MLRFDARTLLAALAAVALLTGAGGTDTPLNRSQALQRLASPDAGKRREAAIRLGDVGVMADVKALVKELRDPDEATRQSAEESMWRIWSRSGNSKVDALYKRGVLEMADGEAEDAIATFTTIIEMKPDFAEAWNKRATVYFFVGDLEKSLADCDEVMKRNPYHFGALSGYFQIYVRLEDYERALKYGRRALEINPNMDGMKENIEQLERALGQARQVI